MTSFLDLHVKGDPFILANAWDIGSAKLLAKLGAKAIGTSSAAYGFTLGLTDGGHVSREMSLAHAVDLTKATGLPVQGDFENGFGHGPEDCAETVRLSAAAGLAGICIEDTALPDQTSYDRATAVARIKAAVEAAPDGFVLTARADGMLTGTYGLDEAITRLKAFEDAGAQCLYAPGPTSLAELEQIVAATTAPVNALPLGPLHHTKLTDYANIGIARVSLGSGLARVTHKALLDASMQLIGESDFSTLANGTSAAIIDPYIE